MNPCQTPECETPADLHLCAHCIRDLKGRLEQGIKLIPELNVTIARLDAVRPGNVEGGNGSKAAGSSAPLDITALEVQMTLEEDTRYTAEQYAADPWAAEDATRVIENIQKAERMISGPEEDHIDHEANRAQIERIAPPMVMRELLPWLRTNAKMAITSAAIRQWVTRGLLTPAFRGTPASKGVRGIESTYHPHEVIEAWHKRNNR